MIEQIALNKSSLILTNILQNTQTFQLLTMNIKTEIIHKKLLKMASWMAWGKGSSGLIKRGRNRKHFNWSLQNCFD